MKNRSTCPVCPYRCALAWWFLCGLLVLVAPVDAIAERRVGRLISIRSEDGSTNRIDPNFLARASALTLRLIIPGTGLTTIQVHRSPRHKDTAKLFRGYSLAPGRERNRTEHFSKRWAAVSLGDDTKLSLNFATPGPHGSTIFFSLNGQKGAKELRIVRAPHYALANKGCLSSHALHGSGAPGSLPLMSRANLKRNLSIATVADHLWANRYGANANSRIRTITNAASAIYGLDLGMSVSIASQETESSPSSYPSTVTSAEQLLSLFSSRQSLGVADEAVMFTGRSFDDGVIGIAWLGFVCIDQTRSHSAIRHFQDALDPIILAHEIGHTLSADHDASGIMTTALNPSSPPTSFSAFSISQIANFVQRFGSCLSQIVTNPTPGPTATPSSSTGGTTTSPSNRPKVTFSTQGSRVRFGLTVPNPGAECVFSLRAGASSNTLLSRGILLRSSAVEDTPAILSARLRRRVRGSTRIYLRGYTSCVGSSLIRSNLLWFDAASLPLRTTTSSTTFLADLKRLLR